MYVCLRFTELVPTLSPVELKLLYGQAWRSALDDQLRRSSLTKAVIEYHQQAPIDSLEE